MNRSSKMLTTTIVQVALNICPQPGVDITGDLEKDVRALRSPSNNFVWAGSMVGRADESNGKEVRHLPWVPRHLLISSLYRSSLTRE